MSGLKLGELILSSKPYAHVLSNQYRGEFCDYCFAEKKDLKRCSQCSFLYFCNKNCQSKAWTMHKTECKFIKRAGEKKPTPSLRLIALIILNIKKHGQEEPYEEICGRRISFSTLTSHAGDIKKDLKRCQLMMAMVITLKDYIGPDNIPSPAEFTEIFGKMCINSFSISHEGRLIGSGLYLGGSIFDHSCDPDATSGFDGTELNVRMTRSTSHRNIEKVCISYIDNMLTTEERQVKLKQQYYFTCQCEVCKTFKNDDIKTKLLINTHEAKQQAQQCQEDLLKIEEMFNSQRDPNIIQEYCNETLKIQNEIMANTHICKARTMTIAFGVSLLLHNWDDALLIGANLDEPLRLHYGKYDPHLGLHLYKIGKILHYQKLSRMAVPKLTEAEEIFKVTHGDQHYLTKDVRVAIDDAKVATVMSIIAMNTECN